MNLITQGLSIHTFYKLNAHDFGVIFKLSDAGSAPVAQSKRTSRNRIGG
jgi:hypothetical protein